MFDNPAVNPFLFGFSLGLFIIVICGATLLWIVEEANGVPRR